MRKFRYTNAISPWEKVDDGYILGEYKVAIDKGEYDIDNNKQLYLIALKAGNSYDTIKRYLTLDEAMLYVESLIEMEENK